MKSLALAVKIAVFAFLFVALAPEQAFAQDPVEVDSDHYTVVFENEQVRVLRIRYGPSEKSVMHFHPNAVIVFLEDSTGQFTLPDGSVVDSTGKVGDVVWAPEGLHLPENTSDTGVIHVIAVELKSHDEENENG